MNTLILVAIIVFACIFVFGLLMEIASVSSYDEEYMEEMWEESIKNKK